MYFSTQSVGVTEIVGVVGFFLYVTNYTLLTLRIWTSDELRYFAINLAAAACVLIGLTHSFNLAAGLIQVFFVAMSMVGVALRLRRSFTPTAGLA